MLTRRTLLVAAAALAAGAVSQAEGEFRPLFNGRDMADFVLVSTPPDTYRVADGVIQVSGSPNGYFATKKSYRNYVLEFDWKYVRPAGLQNDAEFPGNSGLLLHIAGDHKVWPKCVEVQLMNRDAGNIFALNGGKATGKKYADAQKQAIKPVGEWNHEQVTCKDGTITAKINGILVAEATGCDPAEGPIGWQSEGAEIHFRNLRIKE